VRLLGHERKGRIDPALSIALLSFGQIIGP